MKKTLYALLVGLTLSCESPAQTNVYSYVGNYALVEYQKLDTKMLTRAKLYERASETRRKAAEIQKKQAEKNQSQAWDLGLRFQEKEELYLRDNFVAGELYLQAGDLLIAASKNYITSRSNLVAAVQIYSNLAVKENEKLRNRIDEDSDNSESCYGAAIEHFISAGESFEKAKNAEKEAVANMRAASQLESIAGKK